jgi:hypothetical protein
VDQAWPLTWNIVDDPIELASEYIDERLNPSDRNAIDLAVRDIGGFRLTREDWCRYGDRNNLCRRIERAWISRGSTPLDLTAIEVSSIALFAGRMPFTHISQLCVHAFSPKGR